MYRILVLCVLTLVTSIAFAQKPAKPKLIIYGQGEAALASAVQASKSGVPALWINPEASFSSALIEGQEIKSINSYQNLDAGLWAEFLKLSVNAKDYSDSVFNHAKVYLSPQISKNTFEKMIDSSRNLNVVYNTEIKRIRKSGKKWRIELSNGQNYSVFAVIDASLQAQLLPMISEKEKLKREESNPIGPIITNQLYRSTVYRTSLLVEAKDKEEWVVPTASLLKPYAQNLFVLHGPNGVFKVPKESIQDIPTLMLYGQSIGAIASYCAFFETTTDKINIRTLQGELLAYKGQLLPFHDVAFEDVNNSSIQRIGLTGILQGRMSNEDGTEPKLIFDVDKHVSSKELEPVMRSLYTRSQIWFSDKSIEELKLKDLISLLKFIAFKGDELETQIENGWEKKFNFNGIYDPECILTRKQAAILIDTYLQPFSIRINEKGEFQR
jgi:hypothetical protein